MINNAELVSGVQQGDSVTYIHVCILFQTLFPFRLLQNTEQSSQAKIALEEAKEKERKQAPVLRISTENGEMQVLSAHFALAQMSHVITPELNRMWKEQSYHLPKKRELNVCDSLDDCYTWSKKASDDKETLRQKTQKVRS